tara:strand:- start:446 stop:883 length:438 start_codon:yes stop_codon:yes gene_type:complete
MRELLYLKDKELKEYILNIFYAYRNSFDDIKKISKKYSLGVPHCKALLIISISKDINVSELLQKLGVTKQSLNKVINDLIKLKVLEFKKNIKDSRVKNIYLNSKGDKIIDEIFQTQKNRFQKAFLACKSEEVVSFDIVIKKIINE